MNTKNISVLFPFSTFLTGSNRWFRGIGDRAAVTSTPTRFSPAFAAALIAGTIFLSGKAQAQSTWTGTLGGTFTWTNPSNWSPGVPNSTGATADLESALTASEAVDLNGGITLGSLSIGATSGASTFTLAAGTSGSLTMNSGDSSGGAGATITEVSTANGDTISTGIVIADPATTTALTITNASAHQLSVSGTITGTGNLLLAQTGAGFMVGTAIDNAGTVTFDSSGSTVTSSLNIGSAVTEVLNSSSDGAKVQINSLVVNSGGTTLENSATSGELKLNGAVSGVGNLTLDNTTNSASVFAGTGGTINMTGSLINASSGAGAITMGSVVGSAVTGITENSASGLTFNQNNTFNNLITITKGKVTIADASTTVFGDLGDNGSGTGSFTGGISIASGGTFNWASSATQTVSGNITGGGALTVSTATATAPDLVLTGSNTYSGGTTLSSGSVFINNTSGSALGTGSLTVAAGTTFGGSGTGSLTGYTIGAASPAAATTVQVGNGTDVTSNLTLVGTNASSIKNANLEFNLNTTGSSNELSVGTTALTLSGDTLTLNVSSLGVVALDQQYVLVAGTGGTGTGLGQYAGFTISGANNVISGITLIIDGVGAPSGWYSNSYLELVNNANGTDDIDVVFVPEPSTWAMMLGGLATLVFWQRRRRGNNRQ